jgi:hypothetical protein
MKAVVKRLLARLGYSLVVAKKAFRYVPEEQPRAEPDDELGRFREVVSDPLNLLIDRVPEAGYIDRDGYVVLHNGHRVAPEGEHAYYGRFSDILVINRGVHEPLEEFVFQELLRTLSGGTPVMIELGAYWAHYSMWLKKVCPGATCIMVEADERKVPVGRGNFARHGYRGEFIQQWVSNDGFRLDMFVAERQLQTVDILHCDIQGYETVMIEHAQQTFKERRIGSAFISTHGEDIHHAIASKLTALGYRIEVSSPYEQHTTSHDGFIFATSPDRVPLFTSFTPLGRVEINRASTAELIDYVQRVRASRYHH